MSIGGIEIHSCIASESCNFGESVRNRTNEKRNSTRHFKRERDREYYFQLINCIVNSVHVYATVASRLLGIVNSVNYY